MATSKRPLPLLVRAKETTPPSTRTGGRLISEVTALSRVEDGLLFLVERPTDGMIYKVTFEELITAMSKDPYLEISRGNTSGQSVVNKFGGNALVASGGTEDVWDGGGTYTFPTTADITHIMQPADQATMRGQTIEVQGLDTNWDLVVQTKALDASNTTTPVALDTPLRRVFRKKVLANVVTTENVNTVNATTSPRVIFSTITAGNNQTLMAIYTVPRNYTAYITKYYASTTESTGKEPKSTEFKLWTADRVNSYEFQLKHAVGIAKAGSAIEHDFKPYFKINEKTDIKISASADSEDAAAHAGFDLILINE